MVRTLEEDDTQRLPKLCTLVSEEKIERLGKKHQKSIGKAFPKAGNSL